MVGGTMFDLNDNLRFTVHSGGEDGISGLLDIFLQGLETLFNSPVQESFHTFLPGIAAIANIHPLLVHFPIALLTLFFLLDVAASILQKPDWRKTAGWFLYLGTVFAGLTMLAGFHAAETVAHSDEVHEIMETHEHLGVSIFILASVLSVWRLLGKSLLSGVFNLVYLFFAAVIVILLVFAADLGGLMVYHYGVAVQAVEALEPETEHDHEHHHHHEHEN
jgi:uncharacterized membrane protein